MICVLTTVLLSVAPASEVHFAPQEPVLQETGQDAGIVWVSDWAAAQAQAKKEGKDLFIDFTGSDWCGWCIRLHGEVFEHAEFAKPAAELFVFVELDFPQEKEQSDALKAQNQELMARFGVQGFPTIFLADAEGLPFGQTGYQEGGPEAYLTHVNGMREQRVQRDALRSKAEGVEGIDRAKLIAEALEVMPAELHKHYVTWMDEIIALDTDGAAGLKEKFVKAKQALEVAAAVAVLEASLNTFAESEDWGGGAVKLEAFLDAHSEGLETDTRQKLCYYAGVFRYRSGELAKAVEHLEAAIAVAPDSPPAQGLGGQLEQWKKELAEKEKGGEVKKDDGGER